MTLALAILKLEHAGCSVRESEWEGLLDVEMPSGEIFGLMIYEPGEDGWDGPGDGVYARNVHKYVEMATDTRQAFAN